MCLLRADANGGAPRIFFRSGVAHYRVSSSSSFSSSLARRLLRFWSVFRSFPQNVKSITFIVLSEEWSKSKMILMMPNLGERRIGKKRGEGKRQKKKKKEITKKRERKTVNVLDIARGSMEHWRTSPWFHDCSDAKSLQLFSTSIFVHYFYFIHVSTSIFTII